MGGDVRAFVVAWRDTRMTQGLDGDTTWCPAAERALVVGQGNVGVQLASDHPNSSGSSIGMLGLYCAGCTVNLSTCVEIPGCIDGRQNFPRGTIDPSVSSASSRRHHAKEAQEGLHMGTGNCRCATFTSYIDISHQTVPFGHLGSPIETETDPD